MKTDGRHLIPETQEERRRQVVQAIVKQGMSQVEAVRVFGAGRTSIHRWLIAYRQRGLVALRAHKRGPKPHSRLAGHQAATLVRLIDDRCPDQLHLPFALWTREAVQQLLAQRFGLQVSVWTVGRYLQHWGFTPQKPLRRAYEQNPAAVRYWLETDYPAIRRRAKAEQAEIHWGDEMGMRSDHQVGTSYGRRGRTPTIPGTGQRFGCNMISAITNRGRLVFMVFKCRFTTPVFLTFLKRLVRHLGRKAFLIVDGHPVHRAAAVKRWLAEHAGQVRVFYLPGYSPKLNPDELLNQDVKSNAVGRQRPHNRQQMVSTVRAYLHSTRRRPDIVQNYFLQKDVRYAAM